MTAASSFQRVWSAWLTATRQELSGPADALARLSETLKLSVPPDAPPRFAEAVTNIQTRSGQLRDAVTRLLRTGDDHPDETLQRTTRHDLRGHAAYVIGICQLWKKQAGKFSIDKFVPDLDNLEATATHVVTLLDKLVSFKESAPPQAEEDVAQLLRFMDNLPASQERGDILVVDDNKYNRDYMSELLVQQGHRVVTAA